MKAAWTHTLALLAVAGLLFTGAGFLQHSLNRQRAALGLTRQKPLENAPPVLAFTTQALGAFRGLIANALWIRLNDLQLEDKYFEMVQLSDWITKLEPHFAQVWIVSAWNMAYNISVKFTAYPDRWRWVQRGIELLRDEGLRYNPNEALLYRELAWFFQHKIGQDLDDAHLFYKGAWAQEMTEVLGGGHPDFDALANPQTDEARQRAARLRSHYKLDPLKMKEVDREWGPLDWRLPEAHAIYWATLGLEKCKPEQLKPLRRVIYQSMRMAFLRGNLYFGPDGQPRLGPNLAIIDKVNAAFLAMIEQDPEMRDGILRAQRSFLNESIYQLYIHNRLSEAQRWFRYLQDKFPSPSLTNQSVAEFAFSKVAEEVQGLDMNRYASIIQAFITQSYLALLNNQEDQAVDYIARAREFHDLYALRTKNNPRTALPPLEEMKQEVLKELLDPKTGLTPAAAENLRRRLGLPAAPPNPAPKSPAAPAQPK